MVLASRDPSHIISFKPLPQKLFACCRSAVPEPPFSEIPRANLACFRRFPLFIQQELTMSEAKLTKSLSPMQVCALALGSIVGWGCFVLPGDMFLPSAGPLGTLLGFLAGAILISFVGVCYSYMVKYAPVAGGAFTYAYIGFGPTASFICGWALVIGYIAIVMIDIAALSLIFRFLFPGVFEFGELYTIAGWKVYVGEVLLMTAGTIVFGWLNYRSVGMAGKLQLILAFMLTFGIVAFFFGSASLDSAGISNLVPLFAENKSQAACIMSIFALSPFLFVGFDTVPQASEEFAFEPSRCRNIMVVSIFVGMILYAMVMLGVAIAIPYPELLAKMEEMRASGGHAWATGYVATLAFGKLGSIILACAVFGAVCTGINGFFVAASRLLLAMSRGRILPEWFGRIHPTYHTPYNAILFTAVLALLTPFAGRSAVGWTVDMSSVGTGIGYLFTCLVARRAILNSGETRGRSIGLFCCVMGTICSILTLILLLTPGSPAYISFAPRCVLAVWVIMGFVFYFSNKKVWSNLSTEEISRNILGGTDIPILFNKKTAPCTIERENA